LKKKFEKGIGSVTAGLGVGVAVEVWV